MKNYSTVSTLIPETIDKIWSYFTEPKHVMNWNQASNDWHCPNAVSDFIENGSFCYTMAAKDGSFSFDLIGTFTEIVDKQKISYTLADERTVEVWFEKVDNQIKVTEIFEPENIHPEDFQQQGWQAILESFKKYVLEH